MCDNNLFSYEDLVQKYKFSFSKDGEPILSFEGLYWDQNEIFDDNKKQEMISQFVKDVESCKTDMEISSDISFEDQRKIENMEKVINIAECLKEAVRIMVRSSAVSGSLKDGCENIISGSVADSANVRI